MDPEKEIDLSDESLTRRTRFARWTISGEPPLLNTKPAAFKLSTALLKAFLSLALATAGSELAYRVVRYPQRVASWRQRYIQFDPEIGWGPIPNRQFFNHWGRVSTNSLGFRSDELVEKKPEIVLVGDSVVWGFGVSDEETVSYHLQRKVESLSYQVVNAGVSGYGIDQVYLFLKRNVPRLRNVRHVVLVICAGNDLKDTGTNNRRHGRRKPLFIPKGDRLELLHRRIGRNCLRNLASESWVAMKLVSLHPLLERWLNFLVGDVALPPEETEQSCAILLSRIQELVTQQGARLTVVISPSREDLVRPSSDLSWFQELSKSRGYDTIDYIQVLTGRIQEVERIYLPGHRSHYSDYGHRLLAETLYEHLQPFGSETPTL